MVKLLSQPVDVLVSIKLTYLKCKFNICLNGREDKIQFNGQHVQLICKLIFDVLDREGEL